MRRSKESGSASADSKTRSSKDSTHTLRYVDCRWTAWLPYDADRHRPVVAYTHLSARKSPILSPSFTWNGDARTIDRVHGRCAPVRSSRADGEKMDAWPGDSMFESTRIVRVPSLLCAVCAERVRQKRKKETGRAGRMTVPSIHGPMHGAVIQLIGPSRKWDKHRYIENRAARCPCCNPILIHRGDRRGPWR